MIYRSEVRSAYNRLSEGFYTVLDYAKAAVEEHYLSSGGNRVLLEQMCWIEVIPGKYRWINKVSGMWFTPDRLSTLGCIVTLETDEPMPIDDHNQSRTC